MDSPTLTRRAEDRLAWRSLSHIVSTMSPLRLSTQLVDLILYPQNLYNFSLDDVNTMYMLHSFSSQSNPVLL